MPDLHSHWQILTQNLAEVIFLLDTIHLRVGSLFYGMEERTFALRNNKNGEYPVQRSRKFKRNYFVNWQKLPNDPNVLHMIRGYYIDFYTVPSHTFPLNRIQFSDEEKRAIFIQIGKILQKGVICKAQNCKGEFISNIFTWEKRIEAFRTILNLKKLNEQIHYRPFKINNFEKIT